MIYIILFIGALAVFSSYLAWREWRAWYYLRRYGVEMEATVQHKWKATLGMFPHYYLIYEFEVETPDGEYYFPSKYTEIERSLFHQLEEGEPLMVRYAANNPKIFRLVGQGFDRAHWTFSAVLSWICTLFFVVVAL